MKEFHEIGIKIPQILIPKTGTNLHKWSVIACDQFTSQPDYWEQVAEIVGNAPSTLNIVLPEVYLEDADVDTRIRSAQKTMYRYLSEGFFDTYDHLIYIERDLNEKIRKGILLALDLEQYDYNKGSSSLIRATEGTIVDRLPPRIKIRENAPLEVPHILVLIDDPKKSVIDPIEQKKLQLEHLYSFDLMLGSGHLSGYAITNPLLEKQVVDALKQLANPEVFSNKYGVSPDTPVLLFAMGDGNHSLASAKAIWEKSKSQVGMNHPARYALVEIVNIHDDGLIFEPIHRVLFDLNTHIVDALNKYFGENLIIHKVADIHQLKEFVEDQSGLYQRIGLIQTDDLIVFEIKNPKSNLAVGSLQEFLDKFMETGGADKLDYVHGIDVTFQLGKKPKTAGFYLPSLSKNELFKTVILDGALPRKTFSMGSAREKRFYMECREIS